MKGSMQEILLEEADMLVNPIDDYDFDFVTESLVRAYGISDQEVETNPRKAVASINRMKIRRDIKAILRIIEIALLALLAYRMSSYILGVIFTAGIAAIIWIFYQISTKIIGPAVYGTRSFFIKYTTVVNSKINEESDPKKLETLRDTRARLEQGLAKIEQAEADINSKQ